MFFVPIVIECVPTGTVKLSVTSVVYWSSELPCDDVSVPKTKFAVPDATSVRGMPRTVICGQVTGTVRKSFVDDRLSSSSLYSPFERFVRNSATVLFVFELKS